MSLRDQLAAANAAACTVADEGRAAPQRRRDGFPLPSVQDDQPGNVAPSPTLLPPAALGSKSRRKWPWGVGGIVLLLFVIGLADGGEKDATSTAPPAASQAPAVPAQVMLPTDPVGTNAQQPTPPPGPVTSAGRQAAPTTPAERVETPSEQTTATRPQPAARQPQPPNDSSSANAVYYQNFGAARAAGAAPLTSGEPGYRPGLDRDKDGTACE